MSHDLGMKSRVHPKYKTKYRVGNWADAPVPSYLIFDNDSIFSEKVAEAIGCLGLEAKRTAYRSPWQNGTAERWVGSARRELLDHVIVWNDQHLQRLLCEYVAYYNADRVHTPLRDSPGGSASGASAVARRQGSRASPCRRSSAGETGR